MATDDEGGRWSRRSLFAAIAVIVAPGIGCMAKDGMDQKQPLRDKTSPPASLVVRASDWEAVLREDGSGYFGRGSALTSYAVFPDGQFDFQGIVNHLKPRLLPGRAPTSAKVYGDATLTAKGKQAELFWARSPAPIADVFEVFRNAYKNGVKKGDRLPPVANEWRENPPTTVSKKWDDN